MERIYWDTKTHTHTVGCHKKKDEYLEGDIFFRNKDLA